MARVEVTMPKMGESITEGTVLVWHKQPGDRIEQDETLLEIGTDKVDTEVPSAVAGTVAELLVKEGETVDVGTPVALIETEATAETNGDRTEDGSRSASDSGDGPVEAASAEQAAGPAESDARAAPVGETVVDVVMPKMGESIVEGTILKWHKAPGDAVKLDETLLEIATDKVDTEVPSPVAGVLQDIVVPEGETVDVGTVIGRIASVASGAGTAPAPGSAAKSDSAAAPFDDRSGEIQAAAGPGRASVASGDVRRMDDGRFYSPLVRSIAQKEGVGAAELRSITGTGKEGRVTKKDLLAHLAARKEAPAPQQSVPVASPATSESDRVEIVPMDRMRQIIAEHMIRSKGTSAHVTSFTTECVG
jgi:2-oxoglutarate dehydrogenase E2 component (dihydrolipoamide succinyltransferase)